MEILFTFILFVVAQAKDPQKRNLYINHLPSSEDVFTPDANSINSDFINQRNQLILNQSLLLGTLYEIKKEYTVSFNVFPKSFSQGWKSVLHLTQDKNIGDYGDRIPGIWFHEDGSGKLHICAAVNGNENYCVDTIPLPLNQWSSIKVYQKLRDAKYWFSVDYNGETIYATENSDVRDFKNIKVYASDPWHDAQNGLISNLLIINGKAETVVVSVPFGLVKGKLFAQIPKLDNEFLVSFAVYPYNFISGWHSVIHFTNGSDFGHYGDRVPGIWFHADGKGGLDISAPLNGNPDETFTTNPIGLNQWTNVEVSQILRNSVYIYTIRINEEIVFSEINNQVQSFDNVKVYASDPWYDVQHGLIRDFFVINGISNNGLQPIVVLPTDFIKQTNQLVLKQGLLLGTLYVIKKEYTVSFNIYPKSYSQGWKSVLHLTQDKNRGDYGDRIPGIWFHKDGSGKLHICAAVNGNENYCVDTLPLPLNKWSSIKVYQKIHDGKYWFSVNFNREKIYAIENSNVRDFKNIKVYASDPWHDVQIGLISNILIINGNMDNEFQSIVM